MAAPASGDGVVARPSRAPRGGRGRGHTTNAQRCWFLELAARRPAWRIRSTWASSSGRSANSRTERRIEIAGQTGSSASVGSRVGHGCDSASRRRGPGAGRRAPGRATSTRVRKPPGVSSTAANRASPSGSRSAGVAAAMRRGLGGVERTTEVPGQEAGDRRAVGRELVQPGVLAVRGRPASRPGRRRTSGACSGPPRRVGPGASPGRRCPRRRAPAGSGRGSGRWPRSPRSPGRGGRAARGTPASSARRGDRRSTSGIGRLARRKVWRVSRSGSAGPEVATTAATRGSAAPARIAPIAPIECPTTAPTVTSGRAMQRLERRQRVEPELAGADRQGLGRVRAMAADVDGQAVEAGRVQEDGVGQRPVARRLPAVDEGDARTGLAVAGRDEPGRQLDVAGADGGRLERQPEVGRASPPATCWRG